MNNPPQNPQAPAQGTPAAPAPEATTLEQRAAAALDEFRSEAIADRAAQKAATSQPASAAQGSTGTTDPAAPAAGAGSGAALTPEQVAQSRRDRLAAIHARNRARVDEKQRQSEGDKATRELERARTDLATLQARAAKLVDPSSLDEAQFLALADTARVDPTKLAGWMRDRIQNPERIAESVAKRTVDPELASMRTELANTKQAIQDLLDSHRRSAEQAAEHQATQEFCSFTKAQAATAPFAARFLDQHGTDEFYKLAVGAARMVPGADWPGILDQCEEMLSKLAPVYAADPATPQQRQAHLPPAAAQATTVSNALAAGRTAVSADEDWSDLTLDERARRLSADDADW